MKIAGLSSNSQGINGLKGSLCRAMRSTLPDPAAAAGAEVGAAAGALVGAAWGAAAGAVVEIAAGVAATQPARIGNSIVSIAAMPSHRSHAGSRLPDIVRPPYF